MILTLLIGICIALIAQGVIHKTKMYEFPFLAAGSFLAYIIPQFIGLQDEPTLPFGAYDKTVIMTLLCVAGIYVGYHSKYKPFHFFQWQFEQKDLLRLALILSLFSSFFFFLISRLPEELTDESQWTGLPVAYIFFARSLKYGLAIAFYLFFKYKDKKALAIMLYDLIFYLDRILISGRRGDAIELALVFLLTLFFTRQYVIPRVAMFAGLIFGTLLLHSIGDYRSEVLRKGNSPLEAIQNISFKKNFEKIMEEGHSEVTNAIYTVASTDATGNYDYGIFHWNTLVFNYVPAQLLGRDFKNALFIKYDNGFGPFFYYQVKVGSTFTGIADAFRSFGYFGFLKFFLIAYIIRGMFLSAQEDNVVFIILTAVIMKDALHTITHHTQWFFSPLVHIGIFLMSGLYFIRKKQNG